MHNDLEHVALYCSGTGRCTFRTIPENNRNTNIKNDLELYDYPLPKDLIAQKPLARRDDARLMVVDRQRQAIDHFHIRDLPEILRAGDTLVANNTKVIPAQLLGKRTMTDGNWQGLFLSLDQQGLWRVLGKTRGKLAPGETVTLHDRQDREDTRLRFVEKLPDGVWLVAPEPAEDPSAILDRVGRVPLPHYIRGGDMVPADFENYQTLFAEQPGAVAAPTAGLHFTEQLLERLPDRGIAMEWITLHVGLGTFRPISAERLEDHQMHSEWGDLSEPTAAKLRQTRAGGGRIVAVGTTAVRVLETTAASGELARWQGDTRLFIRPPYTFRAVDALMTNFHLPRTTLLVLVYTFGGEQLMREAYAEAIREEYRFYSYGDAMLIL